MNMFLIDSHCHFNFFKLNQRDKVLNNAKDKFVKSIIVPATTPKDFTEIAQLNNDYFYPSYGIHPWFIDTKNFENDLIYLRNFLTNHKTIAIGECGLDFMIDIDRNIQEYVFNSQIKIAQEFKLPLIIHARKSLDRILYLLSKQNLNFVIHSFTGSDIQLEKIFSLGGIIGIGKNITYNRANRLRNQLVKIKNNQFILETDSPQNQDLIEQNQPSFIFNIAETVCQLRNDSMENIAKYNLENCQKLFKIDFCPSA